MKVAYQYQATPTDQQVNKLERHFHIHANIYNKALETLNRSTDWIAKYSMHKKLTAWKQDNDNDFEDVNARAAQRSIGRIYRAIKSLSTKKQKGRKVGKLRYRNTFTSIEYNQSGFSVNGDNVYLHGIGDVPITKHRETTGDIKGVTIKQQRTSDWTVSVICDIESPSQIPIEDIEAENVVGIDLNVQNLFADTEGRKLESLYEFLKPELRRIRKENQNLRRKEKGSNNWEKQRQQLAQAYQDLVNKRDDVLHKLSRWYVDNYDFIAVEDIDAKELSEQGYLGKYIRKQAWSRLVEFIDYKASQAGIRFERVPSEYTSQDCANPECDNREQKPLSERGHSCEECGFTADRDVNAAWNVLLRGVQKLASGSNVGQGLSEFNDLTPVETDTSSGGIDVPLSVVVEAGSPRL